MHAYIHTHPVKEQGDERMLGTGMEGPHGSGVAARHWKGFGSVFGLALLGSLLASFKRHHEVYMHKPA